MPTLGATFPTVMVVGPLETGGFTPSSAVSVAVTTASSLHTRFSVSAWMPPPVAVQTVPVPPDVEYVHV